MNKYKMTVTLKSPVCIARKRGTGNVIETLDYIPGSTIRGALAMLYMKQKGDYNAKDNIWQISEPSRQEKFKKLFNSDNTRFGNCYPEGAKVIPFTASSCKYHPGFSPITDDQHGVLDTITGIAQYESSVSSPDYEILKKYERCEECQSVMDRFGGYYQKNGGDYNLVKVSKRLIARTAIMESLETAQPESLYTLEVLNEKKKEGKIFKPQEFIGEFETDEAFDILANLLEQNNIIRIGSAKSRALGEVEIKLEGEDEQNFELSISDRLNELNEELKDLGRYFFSVTLHSDTILRDEILRFKSTLDTCDLVETLENLPTPPSNDICIFKQTVSFFQHHRNWLSTHLVTGWNTALKLPKEDEVAITKGSVFLFCADIPPTDEQKDNLTKMLCLIEHAGIGERRNEGFGKIRICDEFHLEEHK